jgi:3-methyladenine DNA glycosylase Mpg
MIMPGINYADDAIVTAPRIGVSKAADWALRWYVAESGFVSVRERGRGQGPGARGRVERRS